MSLPLRATRERTDPDPQRTPSQSGARAQARAVLWSSKGSIRHEEVPAMSEQKAIPKNTRGTRRGTQAVAGVAGAAACLAIGWAVGARTAGTHATVSRATTAPAVTLPTYTTIPGGWDDEEGPGVQWGTVPGTGLTPAQPGTGIVPPSTGSGGSAVAATSVTTNAVAPTTTAVSSTTSTGTTRVGP